MTIGKTIRKLRKEKGLTLNQMATLIESDVGNLSRLERDQQGYSDQIVSKIAGALGVPVSVLFAQDDEELEILRRAAEGVRPPAGPFDENVVRVPMGTRPIPVISSVQAGALRDMEAPYEPGDGYAVVYTDDMALSRWTFSLEVEGESMLPRFQPGDLLIVDPELSPNPGNFVVARNGTNQATFKKYRPRGVDEHGNMVFELVPLNEDYPTLRSDTEKLTVLGVVVEHRNKLR
jgi:SOS-response transcriptional repressor LexA